MYPSVFTRSGIESGKVRSILADGRLLVLSMPPSSGQPPVVVLDSPIESASGSRSAYTITTDEGTVTITPTRGCRCGAGVLTRYDPWPGSRRVRVPVSAWN